MRARWRPEGVALAVVLAGLAALLTLQSAGARQVGPFIAAADHFVDSVGVNIHLHYDGTLYRDQFDLIKSRLLELGVRHVRDGLIDTEWQGYYDRHNELGDAGIKGTFITGFGQSLALLSAYPSRVAHSFEAYEAPNEADKSGDPQWVLKLRQAVFRLADLRGISSVRHYPILGPSLTQADSFAMVGDLSGFFDQANIHNYLAGRHPGTPGWGDDGYGSIDWNLRLIRRYSGGKPITTTEIGYQDAPGIVDSVPQEVVGRYLPRLLVEQYRMGVNRTFLYELCDFPNSGNYGLLHADGAPKPGFNAVKSLLNLLADPGPPVDPRPLNYEVDGGPAVRHFAFQKRDGTYFIALWLEEPSFDVPRQQGAVVQGRDITLRLPREMQVVRSHLWHADGHAEARPVRVVTSSVNVHVSDAMQVIEIAPVEAMAGSPGMPGPLAATVHGLDVHLEWHSPAIGGAPAVYRVEASGHPSFASTPTSASPPWARGARSDPTRSPSRSGRRRRRRRRSWLRRR